jgi:hypothetical protein
MSGTEANGTATIDQEQWAAPMDTSDGQEHAGEAALESANGDRPLDAGSPSRGSVAGGVAESLPGSKSGTIYREKQVKVLIILSIFLSIFSVFAASGLYLFLALEQLAHVHLCLLFSFSPHVYWLPPNTESLTKSTSAGSLNIRGKKIYSRASAR